MRWLDEYVTSYAVGKVAPHDQKFADFPPKKIPEKFDTVCAESGGLLVFMGHDDLSSQWHDSTFMCVENNASRMLETVRDIRLFSHAQFPMS